MPQCVPTFSIEPLQKPVVFLQQDDQKSASVQQLNVSVKSSYSKFKGKTLDSKDIGM